MFTSDFIGWTDNDYKEYLIARYNFAMSCDDVNVADEIATEYKERFNINIEGEI